MDPRPESQFGESVSGISGRADGPTSTRPKVRILAPTKAAESSLPINTNDPPPYPAPSPPLVIDIQTRNVQAASSLPDGEEKDEERKGRGEREKKKGRKDEK